RTGEDVTVVACHHLHRRHALGGACLRAPLTQRRPVYSHAAALAHGAEIRSEVRREDRSALQGEHRPGGVYGRIRGRRSISGDVALELRVVGDVEAIVWGVEVPPAV